MAVRIAALLGALASGADAQTGPQCESMLVQQSNAMNSNCCGAGTSCTSGVPSACDERCAATFMPFWSMCDDFVRANLPELVSFGGMCAQSQGSSPIPPPPPVGASGGGSSYVEVTFTVSGDIPSSGKGRRRFESDFRSDIASALNVNTPAVTLSRIAGGSVTIEVFSTSGAGAQALEQALRTQLADPSSDLMTGAATARITNGQQAQMTIQTAGNAPQCGQASWCAPNCCNTLDGGGSGQGTFNVFVDNSFTACVAPPTP